MEYEPPVPDDIKEIAMALLERRKLLSPDLDVQSCIDYLKQEKRYNEKYMRKNKKFSVAQMRGLLDQVYNGKITFSRLVEILNEEAVKQNGCDEFTRGYMCAVANILRLEGVVNSPVKETFRGGGPGTIEDLKKAGVDESDLEEIIKHQTELYY